MIPVLAHEMFHEYQMEYYPEEFVKRSEEQRAYHETDADAFALAYCLTVNMTREDCWVCYKDEKGNDKEESEILKMEQKAEVFKTKFHLK